MNPHSKYHLSFNVGFPNAYDRAYGRTGADIMVHGDCNSAGCYAMTDGVIEEIYILAREALAGGQPALPDPGLPVPHDGGQHGHASRREWYGFWQNLKEGYDYFEITHLPPKVAVCDKRYLINASFTGGVAPRSGGGLPGLSASAGAGAAARARAAAGLDQARHADPGQARPLGQCRERRRASFAHAAARQRARAELRPDEAQLPGLHARPGDAGE